MRVINPLLTPVGIGLVGGTQAPVPVLPVVRTNPTSSTEAVGLSHTLEAEFIGDGMTFQWYENGSKIPGETSETFYMGILNEDYNLREYYCVATNAAGSVNTTTATLTMRHRIYLNLSLLPAINTHGNVRVIFSDDGYINITSPTENLSDTWISVNLPNLPAFDISQYTVQCTNVSNPLTITAGSQIKTDQPVTMSDGVYLEVNTDAVSEGESRTVRLEIVDTVLPNYNWAGWDNDEVFMRRVAATAPVIITQPSDVTKYPTEFVTFTVSASGDSLVYQWYYRESSGDPWQISSANGNDTPTVQTVADSTNDGRQYRCEVSSTATGLSTNSYAATLTVRANTPTVTSNPANRNVTVGQYTSFNCSATVPYGDVSYQWYYRTSSSGSWIVSGATGSNTSSLSTQGSNTNGGHQYRCRITADAGGSVVYTIAVTLTVTATPVITSQPSNRTVSAGQSVTFSVSATVAYGSLSYQWYYRGSSSGSWKISGANGATTRTLQTTASSSADGRQYRCRVTANTGRASIYSNAATLNVT